MGRGITGNGILAEYDIARFFSDAEAVYTYEGTHEINALVIGRALTGDSAFFNSITSKEIQNILEDFL